MERKIVLNYNKKARYIPDNVMEAIQKIFSCKSANEEISCFLDNEKDLHECSFLFTLMMREKNFLTYLKQIMIMSLR